jgi:hypothetical protein
MERDSWLTPMPIEMDEALEHRLMEFLRTGRIVGGVDRCAFLCELFGDTRPAPDPTS